MYANLISRLRNDDLVQEEVGNDFSLKENGDASFQDLSVKNLTVTGSSSINNISNIDLSTLTNTKVPYVNSGILQDSSISEGTSVTISKNVDMDSKNISNAGVLSATTLQGAHVASGTATISSLDAASITGQLQSPNQALVTGLGSLLSLDMAGPIDMNSNSISNISSLGTLPSLSVLGAATVGSLSTIGSVQASSITGVLNTPVQNGITKVGTLDGLTLGNNLDLTLNNINNVGNLTASGAVNSGSVVSPSITGVAVTVSSQLISLGSLNVGAGKLKVNENSNDLIEANSELQMNDHNITGVDNLEAGSINIASNLLSTDDANKLVKIHHDAGSTELTTFNSLNDATLYIRRKCDTHSINSYGASLCFGDVSGSEHLSSAISYVGSGSDDDLGALAFLVHPSPSTNSLLAEKMRLDHTGSLRVGSSGNADASAVLELSSSSKGFLLPRLTTTERDAISSPSEGLVIFNKTTKKMNLHNGSAWVEM